MDGQVEAPESIGAVESQTGKKVTVTDEAAYMATATGRAGEAQQAWDPIHTAWTDDVEFRSGRTQWTDAAKASRGNDRPMLTINKLPQYGRQVIGDGRQNRMSIRVSPASADQPKGSPQRIKNQAGSKDYTTAEIMEGVIRNIEALSKSERMYDKALDNCVNGGLGWLRVLPRYARPDGFEREIVIRAIRNPLSVLIDPVAMLSDEPDFGDARYAFVSTEIPRKGAEARWGTISSFDDLVTNKLTPWWGTSDTVRVAEYFELVDKKQVYVLLSDRTVVTAETFVQGAQMYAQKGVIPVTKRTGTRREIYWSLLDGGRILEGPFCWDGAILPLIPVLGPDLIVDGQIQYESLFRHCHDAQRMFNYWRTAATETVALAPKAPWLAADVSVSGYEADYKETAGTPVNLLRYKFREGVPGPSRIFPPQLPIGEINMAMQASDDVKATLGIYDASIGARSNETSGRAIMARQREGDVGTFVWHDALAKAVEQVGRVLVDMIPRVYDPGRLARLKMPEDAEDFVQLSFLGEDGKLHDLDLADTRYDVAVTTGPSFTTQRQEAAASMMEFTAALAQKAPQAVMAIADKVAAAMDWPGSQEIARRLRKMVPPELLEQSEREEIERDAQGTQAPPDPAAIEARKAVEMESRAKLISAEAALTKALADKAEAEAMAPEKIRDMIAEAIAEIAGVIGSNEQPQPGAPP